MSRLNAFIGKQAQFILDNPRHAMVHAVVLALFPYMTWLSVTLIALVTLRKGDAAGRKILIAAMLAHFSLSLFSISAAVASINTLLTFVPCFITASLLRHTISWRAVAGCFFVLVLACVLIVQYLIPDFVMGQYLFIKAALAEVQTENSLLGYINENNGLSSELMANYLFGIQTAGVVLSAIFSLMFARAIQSQLYYPGGFKSEMLSFRGDKVGLLLLVIMLFAGRQGNVLAINLLPILILYFLFAGLSLAFNALPRKRLIGSILLLVTPLVLLPFITLPIYVLFGTLDSLFNFRIYLQPSAGKST